MFLLVIELGYLLLHFEILDLKDNIGQRFDILGYLL